MILRGVNVLSVAKVLGILYAVMGLFIGALFSLLSVVVGAATMTGGQGGASPFVGLLFGVGSIVIFPIFYGLLGLVGGAIMAALYNLVAKFTGGLELDLVPRTEAAYRT